MRVEWRVEDHPTGATFDWDSCLVAGAGMTRILLGWLCRRGGGEARTQQWREGGGREIHVRACTTRLQNSHTTHKVSAGPNTRDFHTGTRLPFFDIIRQPRKVSRLGHTPCRWSWLTSVLTTSSGLLTPLPSQVLRWRHADLDESLPPRQRHDHPCVRH